MSKRRSGVDTTRRTDTEQAQRRMDELFRALIENASDVITILDAEGIIRYESPSVERVLGYKPHQLIGTDIAELLHPDDLSKSLESYAAMKAGVRSGTREICQITEERLRHKDGSWRILEGIAKVLDTPSGAGIVINSRDITERKRAEETLRESEERFRVIVENAPFGYYRVGKDGLWQYVSPVWERMHGLSSEEIIGTPFEVTQPPDSVGEARELVKRALAGETIVGEFGRLTREGKIEYHSFNIQPVKHCTEIVGIEGFINDITERKRAEAALRASESRFRLLFENNVAAIIRNTLDGRIVDCNDSAARIFGYESPQEMLGLNIKDIHWDPEKRVETIARLQAEKTVAQVETKFRHKDGRPIWLIANLSLTPADDAGETFVQGTLVDITERKRAEEAVRRASAYNRSLIEASVDPLVTIAPDGKITDVNKATEKVTGLSRQQLIGTDFSDYFTDSGKARSGYEQVFREGSVQDYELEIRHRDGHVTPVLYNASVYRDETGDVIGVFAAARDISERKRTEEALRQLSGRLLRLQDEERRRIARQLHETTAQGLAGLAVNLSIVKSSAADLSPRASACLSESLELAEQCSREIRTLSYLLHPPLVDEAGLAPALRWYTAGFAQRSGIEVHVDVSPEFDRLPSELELTLYRIVQEALTNIHRHSGSKTARICLERQPNEIVLTVADEGHGFPSAALEIAGPESVDVGVGIPGMRERLRQLGGRLHIQSGSRGTTLTAILPLGQVTNGQTTLPFGG